jgi:Contractile injection system spike tip protein
VRNKFYKNFYFLTKKPMSDFILITGDQAMFIPIFGKAIVVVRPGILTGTGKATVNKKTICINGDEKKVIVPGCPYTSPPFIIPGAGILSIQSLAANQKARRVKSGGKAVLLKGSTFTAKFQVMLPATQPSIPPIPDTILQYSGTGTFFTFNLRAKAT